MFEVFVHASRRCDVIRQYEPLSALFDKGVGDVAAYPRVAAILCTAGAAYGVRFAKLFGKPTSTEEELGRLYSQAIDAVEASVHVEPTFMRAYQQLAMLRNMLGKTDEAIMYCEKGLAEIEKMDARLGDSGPAKYKQSLRDGESELLTMLQELRPSA